MYGNFNVLFLSNIRVTQIFVYLYIQFLFQVCTMFGNRKLKFNHSFEKFSFGPFIIWLSPDDSKDKYFSFKWSASLTIEFRYNIQIAFRSRINTQYLTDVSFRRIPNILKIVFWHSVQSPRLIQNCVITFKSHFKIKHNVSECALSAYFNRNRRFYSEEFH